MEMLSSLPPPYQVTLCRNLQDKHDAFTVRVAVFVKEQQVPPELEADEYDADALHLIARAANGTAVGTLRIVDKGDGIAKIGRVATVSAVRGQGVGMALMQAALRFAVQGSFTVAILDAQLGVIGFYERLGFVAEGPDFEDAGILHRRMHRSLSADNTAIRV